MTYFQTWHEFVCPKCKAKNFVCDGDLNDLTAPDIEAVECWNCRHKFDHEGEDAPEDAYAEEGVLLQRRRSDACTKGVDVSNFKED